MTAAEIFWRIWGTFSYVAAVLIAVFMVGSKMPRRSLFALRIAICGATIFAATYGYDEILALFPNIDTMLRMFFRTTNAFMVFVLSIVAFKICFRCNTWAAIFCGTAGYCMQHMSQRSYALLMITFTSPHIIIDIVLLTIITAVFYATMYFIALRKNSYDNIMINNKVQIVVATAVVLISIYLNSFAGREMSTNIGKAYVYIFSIVCSLLALFVEFGLLLQKKAEKERDAFKQMLHHEREQYYIEKAIIDVINMKSHDLKHQVIALEGKVDANELERISSAVNVYDSIFKTGNTALNVVLTRKSLLCENKKIKLTCMADGEKLSFISDVDIYSLFGNILDNAMEAVDNFDEEDKRIISLTITAKNNFVFVRAENYFPDSAAPVFVDGMPQTTKDNKSYHGFGMKSINFLTQKYGGDCSVRTKGNIFILDIMFPIK